MNFADAFHADPEESAEQYVMNRMPPDERAAYEAHLTACPACAEAAEEAEIFIAAIRHAGRLKPAPPKPPRTRSKSAC